jgi:plasmid stability protein
MLAPAGYAGVPAAVLLRNGEISECIGILRGYQSSEAPAMAFYVYFHCRPDGTPFYVGKGHGRRAYNMQYRRNPHHLNIIAKYGAENIIVELFPVASEAEAFTLECEKIAELRAAGVKLANQTTGGEGSAGRPMSEKTRLAVSRRGKKLSAEHIAKIKAANTGRQFSAETCEKLRQNMLGKKRPAHVMAALKAANLGRKLSEAHKAALQPSLEKAREAAKEWHASEDGRAWHKQHGKATWNARKLLDLTCKQCGSSFTSYWSSAAICSNNCRAAARRESGIDKTDRVCVTCGTTFITNKYAKARNCSPACAGVAQSQTKRRKHAD